MKTQIFSRQGHIALYWRTFFHTVIALASAINVIGASVATAQTLPGQDGNKIADEQLYSYIGKEPLPPGTIPWQMLRQVKLVENKAKDAKKTGQNTRPEFGPRLLELDKQEIKLYGFVMPLSTSLKQKHFLLSPLPSHCPYCVNQGPDSLVEVVADTPVEYNQWEPIVVTGKFELVNDTQLFYRLNNAKPVKF